MQNKKKKSSSIFRRDTMDTLNTERQICRERDWRNGPNGEYGGGGGGGERREKYRGRLTVKFCSNFI